MMTVKIWDHVIYIMLHLFEISIILDVFPSKYESHKKITPKFFQQSLVHIQNLQWLKSCSNRMRIELEIGFKSFNILNGYILLLTGHVWTHLKLMILLWLLMKEGIFDEFFVARCWGIVEMMLLLLKLLMLRLLLIMLRRWLVCCY